MAPGRSCDIRTIPEPIPEIKIHLTCEPDENSFNSSCLERPDASDCFSGHDCSLRLWPAIFRPGDVIRGVVETDFEASRERKSKDGVWVIVQGVGIVHETPTPVAGGGEPLVVSGYGTLPKFWCLNQGERVEVYLKVKKALWRRSSPTKNADWVTCSSTTIPQQDPTNQALPNSPNFNKTPASSTIYQTSGSCLSPTSNNTNNNNNTSTTTNTSRTKAIRSDALPAKAQLEFEYQLPQCDLPQTFFGTYGKISYWIIAMVQGERPVWTMQRIVVLASQDARRINPDLFREHVVFSDCQLKSCFRSKGVVEILMKLPRTAFAVGECVPVTTEITNSTPYKITGCKLSLFQRVVYYCHTDIGKEEKQNVLTVSVAGNKPWSHQTRTTLIWLHPKLVPSEFGSYGNPPTLMALDYWLSFEVRADSSHFQTQRLVVPIKLGTHVSCPESHHQNPVKTEAFTSTCDGKKRT